jgi:mRNA-degrading endonuclease RelE of RelBE toxin-antitoxin system
MTMNYSETVGFARDFKRLRKKFGSLAEDLAVAKQYDIELFHNQGIDRHGIFKIENAGNSGALQFFKIKKFACRSLKGRGAMSGIRIIYAFHRQENRVIFLEIYYKGEKENEDRERIKDYLKTFQP